MRKEILTRLNNIELEHNIRLLYACESGSRAWGFESKNSDYDVRFIYMRNIDWYLNINIENKRDVIECPIVDEFDINGWDLRKSLKLMAKSNPTLSEWLNSPIVYFKDLKFFNEIIELTKKFYSYERAFYHYYHMASSNFREYLHGDQVRVKKYFYVLRPLLATKWVEQGRGIPPMQFDILVDFLIPNGRLKDDIRKLVERKRNGLEDKYVKKIKSISQFIEEEFNKIEREREKRGPQNEIRSDFQLLNDFFKKILRSQGGINEGNYNS